MTFSLQSMELHEMLRCGMDLRRAAQGAPNLETAASSVVRYLYDEARDARTEERECVLVRLYKTHPFGRLPPDLQAFARARVPDGEPTAQLSCLTLMATAGDQPEWNDRRASSDHQAIPLASERTVEGAPMIAGLIRALGLEIRSVVQPGSDGADREPGRAYNVFHVEHAEGSPMIPAQDGFVRRYGVRSVLGFGGLLLGGELYAAIVFARVPIPAASAARFRNIALDLRVALSATASVGTFAPAGPPEPLA